MLGNNDQVSTLPPRAVAVGSCAAGTSAARTSAAPRAAPPLSAARLRLTYGLAAPLSSIHRTPRYYIYYQPDCCDTINHMDIRYLLQYSLY